MINLTRLQAVDILNRLDRADSHMKLLAVTGGVHAITSTSTLMKELSFADKGQEIITVRDLAYYHLVMHRLHKWETEKFGIFNPMEKEND